MAALRDAPPMFAARVLSFGLAAAAACALGGCGGALTPHPRLPCSPATIRSAIRSLSLQPPRASTSIQSAAPSTGVRSQIFALLCNDIDNTAPGDHDDSCARRGRAKLERRL